MSLVTESLGTGELQRILLATGDEKHADFVVRQEVKGKNLGINGNELPIRQPLEEHLKDKDGSFDT